MAAGRPRPGGGRGVLRSSALLSALALACGLTAMLTAEPGLRIGMLAAAAAFATTAILALASFGLGRRRDARSFAAVCAFAEGDPAPILVSDPALHVLYANPAARREVEARSGDALPELLAGQVAGAEAVSRRLWLQAHERGHAREEVATRGGRRVLALRVLDAERWVWRLDRLPDRPEAEAGAASERDPPVLTLGRSGAVLYMNARARVLLGRRVKRIDDALEDPPLRPGAIHRFLTPEGPVSFAVRCVDAGIGRKEVVLEPLEDPTLPEASGPDGFEELPVPLLRLDPEGRILRANASACRLLDTERAEGRNLSEFMEGLGRSVALWIGEAAAGRGLHRSEFLRLIRPDREIFVQVTLNRLRCSGAPEMVAVLNDATELKTLEAQFVQSQKMQAIGQLAGGVAHDFNNLLTAISGHCDLLMLRHDQGDPDYSDLVQISQNANRAAALVGQLLAFSRKQTLRPELLDLRETLSDLTHLLNRLVGERVELVLKHDPVLPEIRGDRRQLEQVIVNLVVNARDAMPEGGEIRIDTERITLMEPMQRDRAMVEPGEYAVVRVRDQGRGIEPEKLQKVFEPFYTTKRTGEGTGLGLSTVYGIVKQTGGFIFVDSVAGEGSCFTLFFPAFAAADQAVAAPAEAEPSAPEPQRSGSGTVLLVEDEAPVRAFAARALAMRGYGVIEAGTGEEALQRLSDPKISVDLIVTDVVMPGLDGPSWVREARRDRPETPVVFMSGYAEDVFSEGGPGLPNAVFLPKPFSLTELTETVNRQLA
ncbi:response regulator [Salipiger bermudensis]|uniref:ATP-binding response regulator n=1 Tax=Salipiger bermudensis TaxID=344736 RepID=UPI001C9954B5|nr:ATP-binding protein [Salipiger bermudensis]MBY6005510.1 response regulator [Salipiger bermudensis]